MIHRTGDRRPGASIPPDQPGRRPAPATTATYTTVARVLRHAGRENGLRESVAHARQWERDARRLAREVAGPRLTLRAFLRKEGQD
jgi:hypothetical protein